MLELILPVLYQRDEGIVDSFSLFLILMEMLKISLYLVWFWVIDCWTLPIFCLGIPLAFCPSKHILKGGLNFPNTFLAFGEIFMWAYLSLFFPMVHYCDCLSWLSTWLNLECTTIHKYRKYLWSRSAALRNRLLPYIVT